MEVFRQSVQDVLERVDIRRCRRSRADRKPTTPAQPDHDGAPHAFQSSSGIPHALPVQFKTDKQSIGALLDTFNPRAAGRLGSQVSDSGVAENSCMVRPMEGSNGTQSVFCPVRAQSACFSLEKLVEPRGQKKTEQSARLTHIRWGATRFADAAREGVEQGWGIWSR